MSSQSDKAVAGAAKRSKRFLSEATTYSDQVSFIIKHRAKADHHDDYEAWLRKAIEAVSRFKGHLGSHIVRPPAGGHQYEIAARFASREDAENWIHSDTRQTLIEELKQHLEEPEKLDIASGVDYWFTSVTEGNRPPRRWKQWLATVSVIWPLSMALPWLLGHVIEVVPFLGTFGLRQLIQSMCMVGLLMYVFMPPYARRIAKWLSK